MWAVNRSFDKLKVAITYAGGKEIQWYGRAAADHPISGRPPTHKDLSGFIRDMKELHQAIRDLTSARFLDPKVLLQETLEVWRGDREGFEKVVSTCFHEHDWPRVKKYLGDAWTDLNAGDIFGEKCPLFFDGEQLKVGIRPVKKVIVSNNLGHMTSDGFILSCRASWSESREDRIMKAIVENHPKFVENTRLLLNLNYPARLGGADLMALSEDALAVGVRSNTNREAAIEVSKALPEKTVYAVNKFPEELGGGWPVRYGEHLNFMFSMLDEGKALVAPYVFDYPEGSKKTLMKMLNTLSDDVYQYEPIRPESDMRPEVWGKLPEKLKTRIEGRVFGDFLKSRVKAFDDLGSVEVLKNGKVGEKSDSFVKTLIRDEVLDPDGIVLVGGDPGSIDYRNEFHHWVTALREGGHACCVAVVKPGTVIAYHHMLKTNEALEDAGINVVKLDGRYAERQTDTGFGDLILPLWRK